MSEKCETCGRPFANVRDDDPQTSGSAGRAVEEVVGKVMQVRPWGHRADLLLIYDDSDDLPFSLVDESAAAHAGLLGTKSCWWKRCSELRQGGFIIPTGDVTGEPGHERMLCRITAKGILRAQEIRAIRDAETLVRSAT